MWENILFWFLTFLVWKLHLNILFYFYNNHIINPTIYEITFKSLKENRKGGARAAHYIPYLFTPNGEQRSESMSI